MKNGLLSVFLVSSLPLFAQLPAPNAAGVSAGHDIFSFHDIDAANKFWNALGGEPAELGSLKMTKYPGVLFLMRKGDPKGGTEGSIGPCSRDTTAPTLGRPPIGFSESAGQPELH